MDVLAKRWPLALGLVSAVLALIFAGDRETAAMAAVVAVLCYLGAAAFARRWVAWAGVLGFSVLVAIAKIAELTWWVVFAAAAVVLIGVGLAVRAPRRALLAQAAAVGAYGGLAVVALYVSPTVGAVLAGLTLAAHAGWDLVVWRRNVVVPRSLAEACMALDVSLGIGVVVLGLTA